MYALIKLGCFVSKPMKVTDNREYTSLLQNLSIFSSYYFVMFYSTDLRIEELDHDEH